MGYFRIDSKKHILNIVINKKNTDLPSCFLHCYCILAIVWVCCSNFFLQNRAINFNFEPRLLINLRGLLVRIDTSSSGTS